MLDINGNIYSEDFKKKKTDVYAMGEDVTGLYFEDKMTLNTAASFATANATGTFALLIEQDKAEHKSFDQASLVKEYNSIVKARSTWQDIFNLLGLALALLILLIPLTIILVIVFVKRKRLSKL